jgi:hypothetical protein
MRNLILNLLKNNWFTIALVLLTAIGISSYYKGEVNKLKTELAVSKTNLYTYTHKIDQDLPIGTVAQLTKDEIKKSGDKLTKKVAEETKVNSKSKLVGGVATEYKDTFSVKYNFDVPKVDTVTQVNDYTKLTIKSTDSTLTIIPEMTDTLYINIKISKVYRTQYKNWLVRFLHFDWHKVDKLDYELKHTNKSIKFKDVKIIKVI